MAADPGDEENENGKRGEGGGFPAIVEVTFKPDKPRAKQPDEADQRAGRHEELMERFALAMACEAGRLARESGHIRGVMNRKNRVFFAGRSNANRRLESAYCRSRMVTGYLYSSPLPVRTAATTMRTTQRMKTTGRMRKPMRTKQRMPATAA